MELVDVAVRFKKPPKQFHSIIKVAVKTFHVTFGEIINSRPVINDAVFLSLTSIKTSRSGLEGGGTNL